MDCGGLPVLEGGEATWRSWNRAFGFQLWPLGPQTKLDDTNGGERRYLSRRSAFHFLTEATAVISAEHAHLSPIHFK